MDRPNSAGELRPLERGGGGVEGGGGGGFQTTHGVHHHDRQGDGTHADGDAARRVQAERQQEEGDSVQQDQVKATGEGAGE